MSRGTSSRPSSFSARSRAREKQIRLHFEVDARVANTVSGAPKRVAQILEQLIDNALKFTEVGHVLVRCKTETIDGKPQLRFEVHDTGIGVTPDTVGRLFDAFMQADSSFTRQYGGTGMGLAVCKKLATLMEGEIGCDNREQGGSCFWFRVPIRRASIAYDTLPLDEIRARVLLLDSLAGQQLAQWTELWGGRCELVHSPAAALEALALQHYDLVLVEAFSVADPIFEDGFGFDDDGSWFEDTIEVEHAHILVIEELPVGRTVARAMLEKLGHSVVCGDSGRAAIELDYYDAIFVQRDMSEMSGDEFARHVRGLRSAKSRIPIIAMGPRFHEGEVERCRDAGIDDVLETPLQLAKLADVLAIWLPRRTARKQAAS